MTFDGTRSCSKSGAIDFTGVVNGTYHYSIEHFAHGDAVNLRASVTNRRCGEPLPPRD